MEPIRSGTTTERVVRTSLLTAMLVGYSAWCFVDRYDTYPHKNIDELKKSLHPVPEERPPLNRRITSKAAAEVRPGGALAEFGGRFGEPGYRNDEGTVAYFGEGGMLVLRTKEGVITEAEWEDAPKNEFELAFQLGMGAVVGLLGLYLLYSLSRVLGTQAVMTNDGIKVQGYPFVAFSDVKGIQADRYKEKGFVDVEYARDGESRSVRLDDYKIKHFRPIVDEVCRRANLPNPLPATDVGA